MEVSVQWPGSEGQSISEAGGKILMLQRGRVAQPIELAEVHGDLGEPLQCRGGSSGPVRWAGGGGGKGRADIRFHEGRVASSRASPSLSSMSLLEMTMKGPHCQPGRAGGAARMHFWLSPAGTLSPPSHLFLRLIHICKTLGGCFYFTPEKDFLVSTIFKN